MISDPLIITLGLLSMGVFVGVMVCEGLATLPKFVKFVMGDE